MSGYQSSTTTPVTFGKELARVASTAIFLYAACQSPSVLYAEEKSDNLLNQQSSDIHQIDRTDDGIDNTYISFLDQTFTLTQQQEKHLKNDHDLTAFLQSIYPQDPSERVFTTTDVEEFSECEGSLRDKIAYTRDVLARHEEMDLSGFAIRRYYQLDVAPDEINTFTDTDAPNMVYIVPHHDPYMRVFELEQALDFYERLRRDHDTYTVVAQQKRMSIVLLKRSHLLTHLF